MSGFLRCQGFASLICLASFFKACKRLGAQAFGNSRRPQRTTALPSTPIRQCPPQGSRARVLGGIYGNKMRGQGFLNHCSSRRELSSLDVLLSAGPCWTGATWAPDVNDSASTSLALATEDQCGSLQIFFYVSSSAATHLHLAVLLGLMGVI